MEDERRYRFTKSPPLEVIDGDYAAQASPPVRKADKVREVLMWVFIVGGSLFFVWYGMHWALLAAFVVWLIVKIYEMVTGHSKRH
jgi:hypothetical protein